MCSTTVESSVATASLIDDRSAWAASSPVNELADAAGITQTAASQALRVLREQNWVRATRDGRLSRYELIDGGVHHILHFMGHQH